MSDINIKHRLGMAQRGHFNGAMRVMLARLFYLDLIVHNLIPTPTFFEIGVSSQFQSCLTFCQRCDFGQCTDRTGHIMKIRINQYKPCYTQIEYRELQLPLRDFGLNRPLG